MVAYDAKYKVETARQQLVILGLDSLRFKISHLEKELKSHTQTIGSTVNPTYVKLSDQLAIWRLKYENAKPRIDDSPNTESKYNMLDDACSILQQREEIIQRFDAIKKSIKT